MLHFDVNSVASWVVVGTAAIPILSYIFNLGRRTKFIYRQFFPNAGGSLSDSVTRLEKSHAEHRRDIQEIKAMLQKLPCHEKEACPANPKLGVQT